MAAYVGYGDPARVAVDRKRQLAELLQQGVMQNRPETLVTGLAGLGEALFARNAMNKADKAETAYADSRKRIADVLLSQAFPDSSQISAAQLNSDRPVDLTPKGNAERAQLGALGAQVRGIADFTGDPMAALEFGMRQQEARRPSFQFHNLGDRVVRTDSSGGHEVVVEPEAEQEQPPWTGAVKDASGKWITDPEYIKGYQQMHPPGGGSSGRGAFRPASREEAARYGAEAGQIDDSTGRFYPSGGQNAGEFSASERKGFRDKAAALNTLNYLTGEYRKVVDKYGPQFSDTEADLGGVRKTNRSQELLAAHNNLMMFLKGPELFNLGVLTGPDVERLQRTLPEPVGMGTFGQNKNTLGVGLDGLDQFVKYKMSLIPEQFHIQDARGGQPGGQQQLGGIMGAVQRGVQQQAQPDDIKAIITNAFGPDDEDDIPDGVSPEEWADMTPEERALFQ